MDFVTDDTTEQMLKANGQEDSFVDNRLRIVVDPKKIEWWEMEVVQSTDFSQIRMVFARYLYRGDRPVSPDLPTKPVEELTPIEVGQIKDSQAYKLIGRFKQLEIKAATQAFVEGATAGF